MGEPTTGRRESGTGSAHSKRSGFSLLAWSGALVGFYVLSTGPAARLVDANIVPQPVFEGIYAPLGLLADHFDFVEEAFSWYIEDVWQCSRD
jgi:hypothetical protein